MESQMFNQWVQTQIPEASQQHSVLPQHEGAGRGSDDWPKGRSQSVGNLPIQPTSLGSQIDLNEFTSLGDLSGQSTSPPYYNPYLASNYLPLSPFNAIPYGAAWSTPTPIPVSTYSSLNGATTAPSSTAQSQQQQQQTQSTQLPPQQPQPQQPQSSTHQMAIDPLLTLNGSSSQSLQTPFPQSSTYQSQLQQPSQPQSSQTPMSQRGFIAQQLLYTPYYRPQTQQASQGTLSPQALHSPVMPMMQTTFFAHPQSQSLPQTQPQQVQQTSVTLSAPPVPSINPMSGEVPSPVSSTSASKTAAAPALTPEEKEERKRKFLSSIRPLLQPSAFSGAQAVLHLTDRIADYGVAEVETQTRLDILARIRDCAGNHYYRAWSENPLAVDITREWIKAAAKHDSGGLQETIMPLLHLIDRLPFNLESLAASKLGKVIKTLGKGERSPAIKDMASNLERRWRDMLNTGEENSKEDTKKRKAGDPTSNKGAVPVKKAAVGSNSSTKPVVVKKEQKPAVKDAKADSSFFSAPKPKAKLPSFKKAPAPALVKKEDAAIAASNVSQPSNFDPFQEALKSMKVTRKDSPAVSTPPPLSASSTEVSNAQAALKKKKSVSWAPDSKLESIKLIERAVYDDDPADVKLGLHSSRDLDREEGAALHAHLFEEALDWYDPVLFELPPDPDPNNPRMPRGHLSEERGIQEQREQTALSAVYMMPSQIPDSPGEPSTVISEEETDKDVKTMTLGDDLEALFYPAAVDQSMSMNVDSNLNVSQLIGQLSTAVSNVTDTTQAPTLDLSSVPVVSNLRQEQVQQLLAQLTSTMNVAGQQQQQYGQHGSTTDAGGSNAAVSAWGSSATPHQFSDYSQVYDDDMDQYSSRWESVRGGRGRGSRGGRGRGDEWAGKPYSSRKTRPCLFFQQQRCKYGDQCDFLHELVPPAER